MRAVWWPVLSTQLPSGARPHRDLARRSESDRPDRIRCWARSAMVAACCALSGLGCDRSPDDPAVYRLELERIEGQSEVSRDFVRRELEQVVRGSTMFAHGEPARPMAPLPARLRMAVLQTSDETEVLRVELVVTDPPDPIRAAFGRDFEAVIELERLETSLDLEEDLPIALRRAVAVLDTKAVLVRGDAAAIRRILEHPDPELVILAIDWIGRHRLRMHADGVAALVDHADERVALHAVECLAVVGTQEHARALVTRPRLADRAHASRLYETLARLGGPHAVGFLEFAARNEEDPALADLAKRALERARQDGVGERASRPSLSRGHR